MRIAVSRRRRLGHRETHLSLRTVARLLTVLTDSYSGDVEEHYLNYARVELDAFNSSVTDWERRRGFERL